jgi:hypothetical protein
MADQNHNGKLTFNEFASFMRKAKQSNFDIINKSDIPTDASDE